MSEFTPESLISGYVQRRDDNSWRRSVRPAAGGGWALRHHFAGPNRGLVLHHPEVFDAAEDAMAAADQSWPCQRLAWRVACHATERGPAPLRCAVGIAPNGTAVAVIVAAPATGAVWLHMGDRFIPMACHNFREARHMAETLTEEGSTWLTL